MRFITQSIVSVVFMALSGLSNATTPIESITTSPQLQDGVMVRGDFNLASATIGETTYTQFTAPASVTVGETGFFFWSRNILGGESVNMPESAHQAVSDSLLSTGAANTSVTVRFDQPLTRFQRFLLFELGGDDEVEVQAIDGDGEPIDLKLTISPDAWGGGLAKAATVAGNGGQVDGFQRSDEPTGEGTLDLPIGGVSFTPDAFKGSARIDEAAGFQVRGAGVDPVLVMAVDQR